MFFHFGENLFLRFIQLGNNSELIEQWETAISHWCIAIKAGATPASQREKQISPLYSAREWSWVDQDRRLI
jgi:hypothetical protein